MKSIILNFLRSLDLDVKIISLILSQGIKVNEYIGSAVTLDSTSIKSKFERLHQFYKPSTLQGKN